MDSGMRGLAPRDNPGQRAWKGTEWLKEGRAGEEGKSWGLRLTCWGPLGWHWGTGACATVRGQRHLSTLGL